MFQFYLFVCVSKRCLTFSVYLIFIESQHIHNFWFRDISSFEHSLNHKCRKCFTKCAGRTIIEKPKQTYLNNCRSLISSTFLLILQTLLHQTIIICRHIFKIIGLGAELKHKLPLSLILSLQTTLTIISTHHQKDLHACDTRGKITTFYILF